ncbi:hypothetical protein, partial [Stackebrandtia soli]|uniref:hypothetical protein n=1 Tax=Stackebrandtia soli TaxID=1892856 RepID=UPI0039ED865A
VGGWSGWGRVGAPERGYDDVELIESLRGLLNVDPLELDVIVGTVLRAEPVEWFSRRSGIAVADAVRVRDTAVAKLKASGVFCA